MKNISIALLAIALLLGSGCSKKTSGDAGDQPASKTAHNVTNVVTVTPHTDQVPNFSWKDSTGKTIDIDSYRGKVLLINFWATWCGPCKRELPDLVAISRETQGQNIAVIGVSTDRGSSALQDVSTFVTEHGIPYQIVISSEDLESAFGNIRAIPTSFIVNPSGKIVQTIVGGRSKEAFMDLLKNAAQ
jgi:thiol-disulfide isomerase/thioredoxin